MNDDVFYSVFRELLLVLSLVRRNKIQTSTLSYYRYNEERVVWRVETLFVEVMKDEGNTRPLGDRGVSIFGVECCEKPETEKNLKKSRGG